MWIPAIKSDNAFAYKEAPIGAWIGRSDDREASFCGGVEVEPFKCLNRHRPSFGPVDDLL
jgi:hypothetical protein